MAPSKDDTVSANYFEELGIAVRGGRSFRDEDRKDGKLVAVVNEAFAKRFFREKSPLGAQICFSSGGSCPWREIVGVVASARDSRIDTPPEPAYLIPFPQSNRNIEPERFYNLGDFLSQLVLTFKKNHFDPVKRNRNGPYTLGTVSMATKGPPSTCVVSCCHYLSRIIAGCDGCLWGHCRRSGAAQA